MDPLVRASLALQQALARISGTALAAGLGVYLAYYALEPPPFALNALALAVLLGSLSLRVVRRVRSLNPKSSVRLDFELAAHLAVLTYAGVLHAPGGLDGPFYASVYVLTMLVAGFARPAAALAALGFTVLLEGAIGYVAFSYDGPERLWPHAAAIGVFAALNMVLFHAEIARVRRLSRQHIENEVRRMKEAARSYRLLVAPTGQAAVRRSTRTDEQRLICSGVDEVHESLRIAMALLHQALGLHTVALLWLDRSGQQLHIQELLSSSDGVAAGPFSARDGILGAALAQGAPVSLLGPKARAQVPYYASSPDVGSVSAMPVLEQGHARGVLVVDRLARDPFTEQEERVLNATAEFVLRAVQNERVFIQLQRTKIEQGKLYRAVGRLSAAASEAEVIESCVESAREFASFNWAAVTLLHRDRAEHEICAVSGDEGQDLVGQRFRHNSGLVSMAVANRHPLPYRGIFDPSRQVVFSRSLPLPHLQSLVVLPLIDRGRVLGTLVLGSRRRGAFGSAVRPTLEVLASHVAVSLSNARLVKRLEELATTDGLTGLLNKRTLTDAAQQKLRSANRFAKPLAVLICDLDHFKRVNDVYGHDVGDQVIRGLGEVLRRVKRDTDVVGRFGGEEFVVVCEETEADGARLLAERIRSELAATTFHSGAGSFHISCSIGIANCPTAGRQWELLFKAADDALYVSKRNGRDRATVWSQKLQNTAA